ncbi:MAG: iron-sulfur flavoprotein [Firmicutes bacterium]|nr:iron-sulfur flavoprotein [Bacillota bacterium]
MKVLGINGSPRKDGNTAIIIRTIFKELTKEGIDTELIQLSDITIKGCIACRGCAANKKQCVITDDDFNDCFAKMLEADGIILGSPVYSADVTSQIKALIDRAAIISSANKGLFKHKKLVLQ